MALPPAAVASTSAFISSAIVNQRSDSGITFLALHQGTGTFGSCAAQATRKQASNTTRMVEVKHGIPQTNPIYRETIISVICASNFEIYKQKVHLFFRSRVNTKRRRLRMGTFFLLLRRHLYNNKIKKQNNRQVIYEICIQRNLKLID
jgi:hypothetical protein